MPENSTISTPLRIQFDSSISTQRREAVELLMNNYGAFSESEKDPNSRGLTLVVFETEICLVDPELDERAGVAIDFTSGSSDHRRRYGGGKSQALSRAIGLDQRKDLGVVDVTAGLAGDSFVLACLGANVLMLERNPALALMIADALDRASRYGDEHDEALGGVIRQMKMLHTDSVTWLGQQDEISRDVIYLDPMFPERKKKAAVKKEMQLLQSLLKREIGEGEAEERELLDQARRVCRFRVVVKRPRHAPPLGGEQPGYSLEGKSTRFDIYPKKAIRRAVP